MHLRRIAAAQQTHDALVSTTLFEVSSQLSAENRPPRSRCSWHAGDVAEVVDVVDVVDTLWGHVVDVVKFVN